MPEFYKYITCPNCKTEVQYIDQYIHYSETSRINENGQAEFEYEEYIECPECGEHIVVDAGNGIKL